LASFPFGLGAAVGLPFFEAFLAGTATLFNYASEEVMDELVSGVFTTGNGGE
jgi:hypothetical protein